MYHALFLSTNYKLQRNATRRKPKLTKPNQTNPPTHSLTLPFSHTLPLSRAHPHLIYLYYTYRHMSYIHTTLWYISLLHNNNSINNTRPHSAGQLRRNQAVNTQLHDWITRRGCVASTHTPAPPRIPHKPHPSIAFAFQELIQAAVTRSACTRDRIYTYTHTHFEYSERLSRIHLNKQR